MEFRGPMNRYRGLEIDLALSHSVSKSVHSPKSLLLEASPDKCGAHNITNNGGYRTVDCSAKY